MSAHANPPPGGGVCSVPLDLDNTPHTHTPWWRGDRCTTRVVTREDVSLPLWTTHANTNCVGVRCSHGLQVCTDCRVQFVRLSGIRIRSSGRLRLRLVNSDPRRRLGSAWIWIAHNSFSGACAFRMPVLPCIHAPVAPIDSLRVVLINRVVDAQSATLWSFL